MNFVKKMSRAIGAVVLLGIVILIVRRSNDQEMCQSPTFLFNSTNRLNPDAVVQSLIDKLGGLPKAVTPH